MNFISNDVETPDDGAPTSTPAPTPAPADSFEETLSQLVPSSSSRNNENRRTKYKRLQHRNDKNDRQGRASFRSFRRELDSLKSSLANVDAISQRTLNSMDDIITDDGRSPSDNLLLSGEASRRCSQFNGQDSILSTQQRLSVVDSKDEEGAMDLDQFENSSQCSASSHSLSSLSSNTNNPLNELSRRHKRAKKNWYRLFKRIHDLDPRYQILTFFNDLAYEGVDKFESQGGVLSNSSSSVHSEPVSQFVRAFVRCGCFSVWRPTSRDAIRRMVMSEGVGKGLEIKGKSSKRGKFSGYVPFLQITNNEDKAKVGSMMADARVRVFYSDEGMRDTAFELLLDFDRTMQTEVEEAKKIRQETTEREAASIQREIDIAEQSLNPSNHSNFAYKSVNFSRRDLSNSINYQAYEDALNIIARFEVAEQTNVNTHTNLENSPLSISKIDIYASRQAVYGLEMPEKVLWEGYVIPNDISRDKGSEYDTGRPSMPGFQDMNMTSMRGWKGLKDDGPRDMEYDAGEKAGDGSTEHVCGPRPVLWYAGNTPSSDDNDDDKNDNIDKAIKISSNSEEASTSPLCPLNLLMAYEENGKVIPVVSDFDCFLLGTRGVKYQKPLKARDLAMLHWCVNTVESILRNPQKEKNWTRRWLAVKKTQGQKNAKLIRQDTVTMAENRQQRPARRRAASRGNLVSAAAAVQEAPMFGYADPTSYLMMTGAVSCLRGTGAVRHGPEAFNYDFPQELDDEYLVISDQFPGVPWKYVNSIELIKILCDRIDEGFTFPLNPKWVLCDTGWKDVYDKLLSSHKPNVQNSMNVWYPQEVRDKIANVSSNYPRGFEWKDPEAKTTGGNDTGIKTDLAILELRRFLVREKGYHKLNTTFNNIRFISTLPKPSHPGDNNIISAMNMNRLAKEQEDKFRLQLENGDISRRDMFRFAKGEKNTPSQNNALGRLDETTVATTVSQRFRAIDALEEEEEERAEALSRRHSRNLLPGRGSSRNIMRSLRPVFTRRQRHIDEDMGDQPSQRRRLGTRRSLSSMLSSFRKFGTKGQQKNEEEVAN